MATTTTPVKLSSESAAGAADAPESTSSTAAATPSTAPPSPTDLELPLFGTKKYWNDEYQNNPEEKRYDWVLGFEEVEGIIREELNVVREKFGQKIPERRVSEQSGESESESKSKSHDVNDDHDDILLLHLGSGNSAFPEMFREKLNCKNQIVTDISEVCMERMQEEWVEECDAKKADACHFGKDECLKRELQKRSHMTYMAADACHFGKDEDLKKELQKRSHMTYIAADACHFGKDECLKRELQKRSSSNSLSIQKGPSSDSCDSEFGPGSGKIDFIFEKSTIDALLCDDGDHALNILNLLRNTHDSLKVGGLFMCLSMHPPRQLDIFLRLPCFSWGNTVTTNSDCSAQSLSGVDSEDSPVTSLPGFRVIALEEKREDSERKESDSGTVPAKPRRTNFHYCYIMWKRGETDEGMWEEILGRISAEPDADPKRKWLTEWGVDMEVKYC